MNARIGRRTLLPVILGCLTCLCTSPAIGQLQITCSDYPIQEGVVHILKAIGQTASAQFLASGDDAPEPQEEYTFQFADYHWTLVPQDSIASIYPTEGTSTTFVAMSTSPLRNSYVLRVTAMYNKYDQAGSFVETVPGGTATVSVDFQVVPVIIEADIVDVPPADATFAAGVNVSSIRMKLNGNTVSPTLTPITDGYHLRYIPSAAELIAGTNTVTLRVRDLANDGAPEGVDQNDWGNETDPDPEYWNFVYP